MVKYPNENELQNRIEVLTNYIESANLEINLLKDSIKRAIKEKSAIEKICGDKECKTKK